MSLLKKYINKKNKAGEKVLSVFLTAGFPEKENFNDLVLKIFAAGADIIEIGFPFSDPLADGPVIQYSSNEALKHGVNLDFVFEQTQLIKEQTEKPIVLMGYANTVLSYGKQKFLQYAQKADVSGVIIPDVPFDEYDDFFTEGFENLDTILLTTPTTRLEKISMIDKKSRGFLYYVSMTGTTGGKVDFNDDIIDSLQRTVSVVKENPLLAGFGISSPDDVKNFLPYCSGVIVGSAVIKALMSDDNKFSKTLELIKNLKSATLKN
ncbi:MAG: tryptophan synthase subunit alpha [Ignavibacteriaceae bacterium]|nr:tryptophan synthase subunit alpha [Ignavibacteriaceae bacterium]